MQKPSKYLVNKTKQYVYTMIKAHMPTIQQALIYRSETGFTLSGIQEKHIIDVLQNNLNKTKNLIAHISRLTNVQEKLIILLQFIPGRIQHLLAAVPMHLSRDLRASMTRRQQLPLQTRWILGRSLTGTSF